MSGVLIGIQFWRGNRNLNVKSYSFDFVEADLETFTPEEIAGLDLPERVAFHAPHTLRFAHLYGSVEKVMLSELERVALFAGERNAEYVNYHFTFPVYGLKDFDLFLKQKAKENAAKFLKKRIPCTITFENVAERIFSSEEIFSFLVDNGAKICLDTGHLALRVFRMERTLANYYRHLENFLEKFGKNVLVVHLHNVSFNSEGIMVDHTLNGFLDLFRILEVLTSYSPKYLVLEVFSLNAERIPFDYRILENFAEKVRKRI